jgi:antimicrobial peptide system SdpA family protein
MKVGSAAVSTEDATNGDPVGHPTYDPDTSLGRRVVAVAGAAMLLVAYVLHAALPASPFDLPGPDAKSLRALAPQGWAFFTKSPRSESPRVYRRTPNGEWRDATAGPLASPGDLMGLDRMARSQGTELAILIAALPPRAWLECERTPTQCLSQAPLAGVVVNRSNHHSVCGEVGFVVQEVLPWAWRDAPTTMPSKVLRVRVTC